MTEKEKIDALKRAVLVYDPEKLREKIKELGEVSFYARAFAYACRFRGLDIVKVLAENGMGFSYSPDWGTYTFCGLSSGRGAEKTDFMMSLLPHSSGVFLKRKYVHGVNIARTTSVNGKTLPMISDGERAELIEYLCGCAEKTGLNPQRLLYYAILDGDSVAYGILKRRGTSLPDDVKDALVKKDENGEWTAFCKSSGLMPKELFLKALGQLSEELGENRKFRYSQRFFVENTEKFFDEKTLDFIVGHFDIRLLNKAKLMRDFIDRNTLPLLSAAEKYGWLSDPKRRDSVIEYAIERGNTEASAWLLDCKNRTADLTAESRRAEKREERELNASPDSVLMLKKLWGYKKKEDGTIMITKYKTGRPQVAVPEKIGLSPVTEIGSGAFEGMKSYSRLTKEELDAHRTIAKAIIPPTVAIIGDYAFYGCVLLKDIELSEGLREIGYSAFKHCVSLNNVLLPESLRKIDNSAFEDCFSLERVTVPGGVKSIDGNAFKNSENLKSVTICEGVEEIRREAFFNCKRLETVEIPLSIKFIDGNEYNARYWHSPFDYCPKLTLKVHKGSGAEGYCIKYGIKYTNFQDDK